MRYIYRHMSFNDTPELPAGVRILYRAKDIMNETNQSHLVALHRQAKCLVIIFGTWIPDRRPTTGTWFLSWHTIPQTVTYRLRNRQTWLIKEAV